MLTKLEIVNYCTRGKFTYCIYLFMHNSVFPRMDSIRNIMSIFPVASSSFVLTFCIYLIRRRLLQKIKIIVSEECLRYQSTAVSQSPLERAYNDQITKVDTILLN